MLNIGLMPSETRYHALIGTFEYLPPLLSGGTWARRLVVIFVAACAEYCLEEQVIITA